MSQEAEVADAHETWGKHVEQKAWQELVHGQGHEALLVAVGGVSPAESDLVGGQGNEPMVGNGHTMSVGAEVMEDILGTPEGRLTVDDPVPAEERAQEGREGFGGGERLQLTVKAQLALAESVFQSRDELAPKDSSQDGNGQKEAATGTEPTAMVRGESAGGDHTMDMRMMPSALTIP